MSKGWGGARRGAGRKKVAGDQPTSTADPKPKTVAAEPKKADTAGINLSAVADIIAMSRSMAPKRENHPELNPFQLPSHPARATPPKNLTMAADNALVSNVNWAAGEWAGGLLANVAAEGLLFLGYPYLAELAQRPEYRVISETIADDATRKWIDFDVTGDEDENRRAAEKDPEGEAERMADPDERKKRVEASGKMDKVKALKDDQERLQAKEHFYSLCRDDGLFGRSHLYHCFGEDIDGDDQELATPIGDGRDALSRAKIAKGSLKRLQVIEAVWTYPTTYNALNPLREDWYNPQVWYVLGKQIHVSRMPFFIGRPVPDLLKPAYSFGGLSLSQMAKPYVDIWLTTRQSVADLIHSFSVMVLSTDLSTILQPGNAGNLMARVALFNALRDNQGTFVINKNTEEFKNVTASLSGLSDLQAQAQEHMCLQGSVLIETGRGPVPIKDVQLDDLVLTRSGLSRIKWVGVTGHADTLIEIEAGGSVISVTEEHPVWSESSGVFVPAQNVSPSHRLLALGKRENMVSPSHGAVGGGGRPSRAITETRKPADSFIASCGKRIAALSQRVARSIMLMMMAPTTNGEILNYSPAPITADATSGSASMRLTEPTSRNALFAQVSSQAFFREKDRSSAQAPARRNPTSFGMDGSRTAPIARSVSVAGTSSRQNESDSPDSALARACSVPVQRVSVVSVERQPVYNIEVDGLPEFFANGILVHNSAVSRIPLVKLTGISPKGLNASSEGEIMVYDDTIGAYQNRVIRPALSRLINFEQLSLWGDIDPEITFHFADLRVLTEKERGEKQKVDAERHQTYVDMGAIAPEEVRAVIIDDDELPYTNLNPEDVPDLAAEEEDGLEPPGGRPDPKAEGEPDKGGGGPAS